MNILIKLTCLVGLVIAPLLAQFWNGDHVSETKSEVKEMTSTDTSATEATYTEE